MRGAVSNGRPYRDPLFARRAYLGRDYKATLDARLRSLRERYGLAAAPTEYGRGSEEDCEQPTLFPLQ